MPLLPSNLRPHSVPGREAERAAQLLDIVFSAFVWLLGMHWPQKRGWTFQEEVTPLQQGGILP